MCLVLFGSLIFIIICHLWKELHKGGKSAVAQIPCNNFGAGFHSVTDHFEKDRTTLKSTQLLGSLNANGATHSG